MILRLRCWLGGHQLCEWRHFTREWTCRCRRRHESADFRLFRDEVSKW